MDRCPICDVAVKPENLLRHVTDIHPRHPDAPAVIGELKKEPGRRVTRSTMPPFRLRRFHVAILLLVILLGVGGYYVLPLLISGGNTPLPCVSGTGRAYHWHTELQIRSAGTLVTIPANIGISLTCMQILHTHDTSGLIHIEPDTPDQNRVYTLGDFFRVWGKSFNSPSRMLVNGAEVAVSSNVGLLDQEIIGLEYASFTP